MFSSNRIVRPPFRTDAVRMVTRRRLLGAGAAAAVTASVGDPPSAPSAPLSPVVRPAVHTAPLQQGPVPDPGTDRGTWQGWGTSLCWWANVFGDRDDLADMFFTRETVAFGGYRLPGLGLNIVRYNAGACSWNSVDGESMAESPNIPRYKQLEGFWLDWNSTDPASPSWDWSVDAEQRAMLGKARDRGADVFELFSNSPLWWMCLNHNPSGAADGGDNLQPWNHRRHAQYLATVAERARDDWGVTFDTVAAFNEPSADWWRSDGTQEGCHISPNVQQEIVRYLREELDARGLEGTMVSASDESLYDQARSTWNGFPAAAKAVVGRVNVHGYQYEGGSRDGLSADVSDDGVPLWQSEYGDGTGSGMRMADNLCLDFTWLRPTAWVYWQAVDGTAGWGFLRASFSSDRKEGTLGVVEPKYWVFAHYSRHIRPGMRIIDSGHADSVAAYDPDARRLVVVTANQDDAARTITFDLSRFSSVSGDDGRVRRWITVTDDGGERYGAHPDDTVLSGTRFAVAFPPRSVQTFEIDNAVA